MRVVFIVLGMLAIIEPVMAGLAVAILVGWLLLFGGAAHAAAVFAGGGAGRVVWQLILAVLYVMGGFYFLTHPLLGLGTLTLLLSAILLVESFHRLAAYAQERGERGSGWLLVNALITILKSYHETVGDAAKISNQLFEVVDAGRVTYDQLSSTLGDVIPTAAAVGASLDDVGAAYIVLTNAGVTYDAATTQINGILTGLRATGE